MSSVCVRGVELHYEPFGASGAFVVVAHGLLGSVAFSRRSVEPYPARVDRAGDPRSARSGAPP